MTHWRLPVEMCSECWAEGLPLATISRRQPGTFASISDWIA